jgi:ribokinase
MILVVGSLFMELEYYCDVFPEEGCSEQGSFYQKPGGKGFLQALTAAHCGVDVSLVGAIGKDVFGSELKQQLKLRFQHLNLQVADTLSGTAGVFIDVQGRRKRVAAQGANRLLSVTSVPEEWLKNASTLLVQFDSNVQTTTELLKKTFHSSVCSILHAVPLPGQSVGDSVHLADVVICNEQSFSEMARQFHPAGYGDFTENQIHVLSDAKLNEMCRQCFESTVILTLGARGCFVSTAEKYRLLPAQTDLDIIDSSGAGDVFAGAFASGMERTGYDIFKSARFANAIAGLSCIERGVLDAIPTREAIREAFRELGL